MEEVSEKERLIDDMREDKSNLEYDVKSFKQ